MYAAPTSTRGEANSLAELIADCREICAGVLPPARPIAAMVIDLTKQVPVPRLPTQSARRVVIDIRDSVVRLVDGFGDYGA